jgi:hypothetical protein
MNERESHAAVISALTTEHFVLQTAANATVSDAAARSSLYVFALSSSLVAMGFASRSRDIFVPFAAIVLPGLFVFGLLTIVRLVDSALENMRYLEGIARIRGYYRTLSPEAATHFAARHGRWPEAQAEPSLRHGPLVALFTTSAGAIALINNIVAGVGAALLAGELAGRNQTRLALLTGGIAALMLTAAFLAYERWRFRVLDHAADGAEQTSTIQRPARR